MGIWSRPTAHLFFAPQAGAFQTPITTTPCLNSTENRIRDGIDTRFCHPTTSSERVTPKDTQRGNGKKYLKRAKRAWTELEAEGIIQIERFRDGWRIMPGASHLDLHRGVRQSY